MSAGLDIDHLRGWIGRLQVLDDEVTEDLARKYHATLDMPGEAPRRGQPVPRLLHFCLAQPAVPEANVGHDGHPARGGFLPPVPLPRRMWAGGSVTFHGDLLIGQSVRRVSTVEDVVPKQGSTGPLCFVSVSHRIEVDGHAAVDETQTLVYRETEGPSPPQPGASTPAAGEHRRDMSAGPLLLFRYSALTFNGHRIHYDRPHATTTEGYPGLVVHGPLQAALLLNFAAELRGTQPARFSFRGLAPLFDGEPFTLNATRQGDAMRLWTAKSGATCMSAEAAW
jgi:3-methylfumaryl-CoA hydratase